ncbi:MAG: DUF5916 domain-containing protein [Candidatus Aminicenantes bacterium]|jgi:hypothetical protein
MKKTAALIWVVLSVSLAGQLGYSYRVEKRSTTVNTIKYQPTHVEGKQYLAKKTNPRSPVIDGKLDDPVWERGEWESRFIQSEPYEGQPPSQKTAFKVLYDGKNIYFAVQAFDKEPDKIEKRLARRDSLEGDMVEVLIDSYFDRRTAFCFAVNAAGVKGDRVITGNGQSMDPNWDPIWYVKTGVNNEGWTAEMKIPLSQLRYGKKGEQVWGLQVTRNFFRKEETSEWQFIPKDVSGFVNQFGELRGISGIQTSRKIELYPYTVGMLESFQEQAGNPFATGRSSSLVGGVDGKIGITSDLTLDFAINPDFGQVEADPSEVNLTAYETFFEEKRQFFIEGRSILSFKLMLGDGDLSSDQLFYSRRIGHRPSRTLYSGGGEYVDMPQNTSILGAFKLTGKTKSGLSIGIIDGITPQEKAQIFSLGQYSDEIVEPLTNYFGIRLQKDYNEGNTVIGGMLTSTNRNITDPNLDFLHNSAYTGGVDLYHTWKDKTYFVSFNAVFSHVRGSIDAIQITQLSPLRYFQRPDAKHIEFDPNRTSLSGYGGTLVGGKLGSGHFQYIAGFTVRSPGLELNDMGYLRDADSIVEFIWANYRIWKPVSIFRQFSFNFNQWRGWNFGGERTFAGGNMGFNGQFKSYWTLSTGINHNAYSLSDSALRGGPSLVYPGMWGTWVTLGTDSRKKIRLRVSWNTSIRKEMDSRINSFSLGLNFNPSKATAATVQPILSLNENDLQYVCQKDFGPDKRYVFARIDQKTFGITLRLNLSLTPDLSIQFYGQPFVSAGEYTDFKHISSPRAAEYRDRFHALASDEIALDSQSGLYTIDENKDGVTDYSFGNPNFMFLQFRSNLVLRWEYKPGSALYLVWSQGRTGYLPYSDFALMNSMQDLFQVHPHNVFLIKFSYGFNL